ncbi:MAG: dihydrofolate reductase [Oscillospiraceae bacterium]
MIAIVNADQNWGIGKNGDLLFPIPEDMRFFRETTLGKTVIMGSRTLLSFPGGQPLKNRSNIVLSRKAPHTPGVTVCGSLAALQKALAGLAPDEVYVIGGESVYRLLLPYCSTALVTRVQKQGEADTFFPNLDRLEGWRLAGQSAPQQHQGIAYTFCTYNNTNVQPLHFTGEEQGR